MTLKEKTLTGLKWSGIAQFGRQMSQFVITAILARLLSPDDFGLLGMATVFTGFMMIFSEMGVSSALIQKQDIDDGHLSSAFWLNVIVGVVLTLLLVAVSPLVALFYNQPALQPIIAVMSVGFIFASFSVIQQTILQREMDFKAIAKVELVSILIAGAVGIVMAFRGFGVWSLVGQFLALHLIRSIVFWIISSWRPQLKFSMKSVRDFIEFSAHMTGFNIINYLNRNIDYLLIGKFLGAEALGFYTLAYKIMLYPLQNISWVISKVMFPAFSIIQKDLERLKRSYLKVVKAVSLVTFPMMTVLLFSAREVIIVIFGEQWAPVIPLIRIFCLCGAVQSINTLIGNIILSQGKSGLQLRLGILGFFAFSLAIIIGLKWGITGVAVCYTIIYTLWSIFAQDLTNRLIGLKNIEFIGSFSKAVTSSLAIGLILWVLSALIHVSLLADLIIYLSVSFGIYIVLLFLYREIRLTDGKLIITLKE
jgi:PST family polysaccharide transporter